MEKQEVIDILTQYNKWRRGELEDYPVAPSVLGVAIEWAIKYLEKKDERLRLFEGKGLEALNFKLSTND